MGTHDFVENSYYFDSVKYLFHGGQRSILHGGTGRKPQCEGLGMGLGP